MPEAIAHVRDALEKRGIAVTYASSSKHLTLDGWLVDTFVRRAHSAIIEFCDLDCLRSKTWAAAREHLASLTLRHFAISDWPGLRWLFQQEITVRFDHCWFDIHGSQFPVLATEDGALFRAHIAQWDVSPQDNLTRVFQRKLRVWFPSLGRRRIANDNSSIVAESKYDGASTAGERVTTSGGRWNFQRMLDDPAVYQTTRNTSFYTALSPNAPVDHGLASSPPRFCTAQPAREPVACEHACVNQQPVSLLDPIAIAAYINAWPCGTPDELGLVYPARSAAALPAKLHVFVSEDVEERKGDAKKETEEKALSDEKKKVEGTFMRKMHILDWDEKQEQDADEEPGDDPDDGLLDEWFTRWKQPSLTEALSSELGDAIAPGDMPEVGDARDAQYTRTVTVLCGVYPLDLRYSKATLDCVEVLRPVRGILYRPLHYDLTRGGAPNRFLAVRITDTLWIAAKPWQLRYRGNRCNVCGAAHTVRLCRRCNVAQYCSVACQAKADGAHTAFCDLFTTPWLYEPAPGALCFITGKLDRHTRPIFQAKNGEWFKPESKNAKKNKKHWPSREAAAAIRARGGTDHQDSLLGPNQRRRRLPRTRLL